MLNAKQAFQEIVSEVTCKKPEAKIVEQGNSVTIFNEGVFPNLIAEAITLTIVDGRKVVFSYEENLAPADYVDEINGDCPSKVIEKSKAKIQAILGI
jgi:hypothetical protein